MYNESNYLPPTSENLAPIPGDSDASVPAKKSAAKRRARRRHSTHRGTPSPSDLEQSLASKHLSDSESSDGNNASAMASADQNQDFAATPRAVARLKPATRQQRSGSSRSIDSAPPRVGSFRAPGSRRRVLLQRDAVSTEEAEAEEAVRKLLEAQDTSSVASNRVVEAAEGAAAGDAAAEHRKRAPVGTGQALWRNTDFGFGASGLFNVSRRPKVLGLSSIPPLELDPAKLASPNGLDGDLADCTLPPTPRGGSDSVEAFALATANIKPTTRGKGGWSAGSATRSARRSRPARKRSTTSPIAMPASAAPAVKPGPPSARLKASARPSPRARQTVAKKNSPAAAKEDSVRAATLSRAQQQHRDARRAAHARPVPIQQPAPVHASPTRPQKPAGTVVGMDTYGVTALGIHKSLRNRGGLRMGGLHVTHLKPHGKHHPTRPAPKRLAQTGAPRRQGGGRRVTGRPTPQGRASQAHPEAVSIRVGKMLEAPRASDPAKSRALAVAQLPRPSAIVPPQAVLSAKTAQDGTAGGPSHSKVGGGRVRSPARCPPPTPVDCADGIIEQPASRALGRAAGEGPAASVSETQAAMAATNSSSTLPTLNSSPSARSLTSAAEPSRGAGAASNSATHGFVAVEHPYAA